MILIHIREFQNTHVLYKRSRDYWLSRLDTLPAAPPLPSLNKANRDRPEFERHRYVLPADMWQSLKKKAVSESMTHSSILCAAFAEVLSVWSGEQSFTINTTVFNRIAFHKEVNNILGEFTNTVLLEVDWSKNTFKER